MVYDCFLFYNELELLEIRLNELNSVVDKFVIVEATRTFQKQEKKLYYNDNKHLFEKFHKKIIHVVIDKYPTFFTKFRVPSVWDYDNYQKEQIIKGIEDCHPNDQIIVSDVDEIPRPELIEKLKTSSDVKVFEQRFYNYFVNYLCTHFDNANNPGMCQINKNGLGYWRGSVMLPYSKIKTIKKTRLIRTNHGEPTIIEDGGWHFSFLGGIDRVIKKLKSYTHPEVMDKYDTREKIEEAIRNGEGMDSNFAHFKLVPVDNTLPQYVVNNQDKFANLIYTA